MVLWNPSLITFWYCVFLSCYLCLLVCVWVWVWILSFSLSLSHSFLSWERENFFQTSKIAGLSTCMKRRWRESGREKLKDRVDREFSGEREKEKYERYDQFVLYYKNWFTSWKVSHSLIGVFAIQHKISDSFSFLFVFFSLSLSLSLNLPPFNQNIWIFQVDFILYVFNKHCLYIQCFIHSTILSRFFF